MKSKLMIPVLLSFVLLSCNFQTEDTMKTEISIYPSGGGEIGYVLSVSDNLLTAEIKELGIKDGVIVLEKTISSESKRLSSEQVKRIQEDMAKLKKLNVQYDDAELTLDTWVFSIVWDHQPALVVNSFLLSKSSTDPDIKNFIKYLINLSPLKIELKGFS